MRLVDDETCEHAVGVQSVHCVLQRHAGLQPFGRDQEHLGARARVVERAEDLRAAAAGPSVGGAGGMAQCGSGAALFN